MLTFADDRGLGSEKIQQSVFMGKKNVDREDNWIRFNHTCYSKALGVHLVPSSLCLVFVALLEKTLTTNRLKIMFSFVKKSQSYFTSIKQTVW